MSIDRTLYINNLHDNISEALLYELFSQAGYVEDIRIIDKGDYRFGFIEMEDKASIMFALDMFTNTRIFGQILNVKPKSGSCFNDEIEKKRRLSLPVHQTHDKYYSAGHKRSHTQVQPVSLIDLPDYNNDRSRRDHLANYNNYDHRNNNFNNNNSNASSNYRCQNYVGSNESSNRFNDSKNSNNNGHISSNRKYDNRHQNQQFYSANLQHSKDRYENNYGNSYSDNYGNNHGNNYGNNHGNNYGNNYGNSYSNRDNGSILHGTSTRYRSSNNLPGNDNVQYAGFNSSGSSYANNRTSNYNNSYEPVSKRNRYTSREKVQGYVYDNDRVFSNTQRNSNRDTNQNDYQGKRRNR